MKLDFGKYIAKLVLNVYKMGFFRMVKMGIIV
jgi:hypothetical protein